MKLSGSSRYSRFAALFCLLFILFLTATPLAGLMMVKADSVDQTRQHMHLPAGTRACLMAVDGLIRLGICSPSMIISSSSPLKSEAQPVLTSEQTLLIKSIFPSFAKPWVHPQHAFSWENP